MDFKDSIKQLAERILKTKDLIQTEESTKHALVMPFIQALGYDVFNPMEVFPEFIADIGIKKGEKVDYAIMQDGAPIILIECKHWASNLNPHNSQLFRYFHTTKAKFSILTNGLEYRFYTDLLEQNKMDEKPFFIFDIRELKDNNIEELKKFHKAYYNKDIIVSTANELKYIGELKALFHKEINNPTPEFVKFFVKQIYPNLITQKILDQFTELSKKAWQYYFNDTITGTLKSALKTEEDKGKEIEPVEPIVLSAEIKVETTPEEVEGFQIVRSILRKEVAVKRIVARDAQTYFAILFDDNNRKPLCRLYLNGQKKYLALFDDSKNEVKKEISTIDDIFIYSDQLLLTLHSYLPKVDIKQ